MSETYSVVVSGQLVEGFELSQVKENIMRVFKLSSAQADKLLCGKPVALKRGIENGLAVKLSQRLQALGAVSMVKAATSKTLTPEPQQPEPAEPEPTKASALPTEQDADKTSGQADTLECPRCGHSQPVSNSCQQCQMDLSLHLLRTERRARVVANILKQRQSGNSE